MHVVMHTAVGTKIEMDLDYDPSFQADVNTRVVLAQNGACEPEVVQLMARVLRDGDFAIDVGANIGFFTVAMSKLVGATGRVLAFEPGPQNKHKLADNLALNKCRNVTIEHCPLWSEKKSVMLYLSPDSGLNSLGPHELAISSVELQADMLDSYCRDYTPRLIKIDVEGAEEHVLRGAERLVGESRVPFITCELNEMMLARLNSTERSLRKLMQDWGYSTFLLRPDGTIPVLVPPSTVIRRTSSCWNILFSSLDDISKAWPEVAA